MRLTATKRPPSKGFEDSGRIDSGLFRSGCAQLSQCFFLCGLAVVVLLNTDRIDAAAMRVTAGQAATAPQQQPSSKIGELSVDDTTDKNDDLPRLKNLETSVIEQKFQESIPGLTDYLKYHPQSARGHYDLGYVLFRTHQLGASVKELAASLKLNVKNAEAHKILGLDCNLIGRYDLAERELEVAAELKPASAEIHYLLGRLYYTKGVYPLAKREFESAVRLDPSYMKAHNNLGLTLEILGNNPGALENYQLAAQLEQEQKLNSEWPYVYMSAYYNRQENPEQALEFGRRALKKNPKSDLAYFQIAKAYRTRNEWENSADAVKQAININPKTPDFYFVLSNDLRKLGKADDSQKALEIFRKLQEEEAAKTQQRAGAKETRDPSMVLRDNE